MILGFESPGQMRDGQMGTVPSPACVLVSSFPQRSNHAQDAQLTCYQSSISSSSNQPPTSFPSPPSTSPSSTSAHLPLVSSISGTSPPSSPSPNIACAPVPASNVSDVNSLCERGGFAKAEVTPKAEPVVADCLSRHLKIAPSSRTTSLVPFEPTRRPPSPSLLHAPALLPPPTR